MQKPSLTTEQLRRIEENRRRAQELRAKRGTFLKELEQKVTNTQTESAENLQMMASGNTEVAANSVYEEVQAVMKENEGSENTDGDMLMDENEAVDFLFGPDA